MLKTHKESNHYLKHYQMISISQKSKLVTYEVGDDVHASLWRRHENWRVVFHQITKKNP